MEGWREEVHEEGKKEGKKEERKKERKRKREGKRERPTINISPPMGLTPRLDCCNLDIRWLK